MPQIPTYTRRLLPPVARLPRAPMRNPALGALRGMGSVAAQIGNAFSAQELQLRRTAEFTNLTTKAAGDIFNLRLQALQSPEFFSNPTKAGNDFAAALKSLREKYTAGIKDPYVLGMFKRYWAQKALRSIEQMTGETVAQDHNLTAGRMQEAIMHWSTMAERAPDEKEGLEDLGHAIGIYGLMQRNGLIKPEKAMEEAEKLKSNFAESRMRALVFDNPQGAVQELQEKKGIAALLRPDRAAQLEEMASRQIYRNQVEAHANAERANKELATAQNNRVYDGIVRDFHLNDPKAAKWDAAIEYAQGKPPALTVNPMEQSEHLAKQLMADRERMQKIGADKEKAVTSSFSDWLSGQEAKGDPPSRDAINSWRDPKTGEAASPEVRERALQRIGKPQHTDRQVEDRLDTTIEREPFDKELGNSIHLAYLNGKISETDKNRLLSKLKLWRNPVRSPALQGARNAFWAKYGNAQVTSLTGQNNYLAASAAYRQFIGEFESLVAQQDLKPSQYQEQADKMLADVDKRVIAHWWFPFYTRPESAQEYYDETGSWPEPRIVPAGRHPLPPEDKNE